MGHSKTIEAKLELGRAKKQLFNYRSNASDETFITMIGKLEETAIREFVMGLPCSIDINFHPDYDTDEDWRVYPSIGAALDELQIDLKTFSENYMEYDHAKIIGFPGDKKGISQ